MKKIKEQQDKELEEEARYTEEILLLKIRQCSIEWKKFFFFLTYLTNVHNHNLKLGCEILLLL